MTNEPCVCVWSHACVSFCFGQGVTPRQNYYTVETSSSGSKSGYFKFENKLMYFSPIRLFILCLLENRTFVFMCGSVVTPREEALHGKC